MLVAERLLSAGCPAYLLTLYNLYIVMSPQSLLIILPKEDLGPSALSSQAPHLNHLIPHRIPCLNKQRHHHPHATQKRRCPRAPSSPNIQQVIHNPTPQISKAQRVQPPAIHFRDIACDHCRGEQPDVLEAVLLRGLGANDGLLGGGVEGGVGVQRWDEGARGAGVEFLGGRFGVVEGGRVDVGGDGEDPRGGDGVKGEVAG
jgi:hypothetical protein